MNKAVKIKMRKDQQKRNDQERQPLKGVKIMDKLRLTDKSVILETTHRIHGCLEQGGISGRKVAYPLADVADLIGCDPSQVSGDTLVAGYNHVTVRDLVERTLTGRVIRKGWVTH